MAQGKMDISMNCCGCGTKIDAYTGVEGESTPIDGDLSICAYCATIGKYAENLTKHAKLTKEELEIMKDKEPDLFKEVQQIVDMLKKKIQN
jgi:hypothetical protein